MGLSSFQNHHPNQMQLLCKQQLMQKIVAFSHLQFTIILKEEDMPMI